MNQKRIKVRAKINLALDVLGKREDGYHEVRMIMQTIDLYDKMEFKLIPNGIVIHCNHKWVPRDQRNIVYKVAKFLQEEYNIQQGVEIKIHKKIPVSAGLAGGSANGAGTLKVLNELWDLHLPLKTLMNHGEKIGADIPFCLLGGTALAEGIGEILHPLPPLPPTWLVLVKPPIYVSTAWAYRNLELNEEKQDSKIDKMIQEIKTEDMERILPHLYNVLESITIFAHPEISTIKNRLKQLGAKGVLMSGSGPTVFGICKDRESAQNIYTKMKRDYREVFMVKTYNKEDKQYDGNRYE